MKKTIALTMLLLLTGCRRGAAEREELLRKALADTNVALTEAQDRAKAYQEQSQRLARKYHAVSGHKTRTAKKGK